MARSSIGLDVGTKAVRIAEVRYGSGGPSLTRFGRALLPAGAVEHGEVQDPEAVGLAISGLWKQLGLKSHAVHVGVANRHCVVRVLELPVMSKEDLESAIRLQAQEQIPIPLSEAVMDFEVLEEIDGPEGQRLMRVLVVAAERTTIDPLLRALNAAHLEPQSLELNAYPLVRCFNGTGAEDAHVIVDVGGGVTNVVVHQGGKIRFTRILPNFGGEDFTTAITESLGLERPEAEALKRSAASTLRRRAQSPSSEEVGQVLPDSAPIAEMPTPRSPEDVAADLIEPLLNKFVNEVRGSIDFYTSQPSSLRVERVVVTGGGSLLGGLAERLGAALGLPVEHGHAFSHFPGERTDASKQQVSIAEPFLGVAVGLALAENGG